MFDINGEIILFIVGLNIGFYIREIMYRRILSQAKPTQSLSSENHVDGTANNPEGWAFCSCDQCEALLLMVGTEERRKDGN